MSSRLISFYKGESINEEVKWAKQIRKLFKYMALMDKSKYLEPKFSESLESLSSFLKKHLVSNFKLYKTLVNIYYLYRKWITTQL